MYLEQLLACVDVLLHQCESDCDSVSLQLLQVLVTVQSLSTEPRLSEKVRKQYEDAIPDASSFFHHFVPLGRTSTSPHLCNSSVLL